MKDSEGFIHFDELDQGVTKEIRDGQRRKVTRSLTKEQRKQAARIKVTIDLPEELKQHLDDKAAALGVPLSQLYRWVILRGLDHTTYEELEAARMPSRSMRYEFILFPIDASPKGQP